MFIAVPVGHRTQPRQPEVVPQIVTSGAGLWQRPAAEASRQSPVGCGAVRDPATCRPAAAAPRLVCWSCSL